MFTREEASRIRHEFWTTLGRYMAPVPSANGLKINWINYHTGVKDLYFRMDAGPKSATISISIEHRDPAVQEMFFEQFLQFKNILQATLEEDWIWNLHESSNGKLISKIYKELSPVSVFNKDDWPVLIPFFKPRIIALDSFWEDAKYSFYGLM